MYNQKKSFNKGDYIYMKPIHTKYSRQNPGHYVPAIKHNDTLYISGQLSIDFETGQPPEGGIKAETKQALYNLDLILNEANLNRNNIIMCRIYTPDVQYWDEINQIYSEYFNEHIPARVIVPTTTLHHNCLIEIEAIADYKE
ncbi:RidA family protein [Staphylococcus shinii]|uniref:RidA family protein n=1 Tax=Staphylococcus shinii TaxID=2912228 RepID=UPI003510FFBA